MILRRQRLIIGGMARLAVLMLVLLYGSKTFKGDVNLYYMHAYHLSLHHLPYRSFLWEYPPLSALPLVLIPLSAHTQYVYWLLFFATMITLECSSLRLLCKARPQNRDAITAFWTVTMVPLSAIAYFRLDYLVVFFATLALTSLLAGRSASVAIVAGFATKLWPVAFVVVLAARRRYREVAQIAAGCIAVLVAWWRFSPYGFHEFLRYRTGTGFQIESIPGSLLLLSGRKVEYLYGALVVRDTGWHWIQYLLTGLLLLTFAAAFIKAWQRPSFNAVALIGGLVCAMMLFNRLLSPQFLTWLGPFVALLWLERRRIGVLFGMIVAMTLVEIQLYTRVRTHSIPLNLLVTVRNGVLIWLMVELFRAAFCHQFVQEIQEAAT